MRSLSFLLPLLLSTACFDEPSVILPQPPPDDSPALDEGVYELQVVAVDDFSCPGMRARDLIGQEMWGSFGRSGKKVSFDLQGLPMEGRMKQGRVSMAGHLEMSEPEPVPVDDPAEPTSDGDEPVSSGDPDDSTSSDASGGSKPDCGGGSSDPSTGGSSGGSAGSSGGSEGSSGGSGGSTPPDDGEDCGNTEPSVLSMEAVAELEVLSSHLAEGSLWYQVSGSGMTCSFEVQVVMAFVGDAEEPPVV
ncbi:MAG TPA: hypothetical protein PKY30_26910, partial [Myxococcota bacterium]|nr:hypothetical protein [Myxococcota bacterium]